MKKPTRTVSAQRSPLPPAALAAVRGGFFGALLIAKAALEPTDDIDSTETTDDWSNRA
jgi:hypothetical protein